MTLRVGLWCARADRRGLAVQSEAFDRWMQPAAVVGVDLGEEGQSPYPNDWTRFRDVTVVTRDQIHRPLWDEFAAQVDVAVAIETTYVDEVYGWAAQTGTPLVVWSNPEFARWAREPDLGLPDVILTPTDWMYDRMPAGTIVQPFPIDRDLLPYIPRPVHDSRITFLHVAGRRAARDRDGLSTVVTAVRQVQVPCRVLIRTPEPLPTRSPAWGRKVDFDVQVDDEPDYWRLYGDGDVLLLPRRYAGQSLKMLEAASAGLPVIMSDVAPQNGMGLPPELLVPAAVRRQMNTQVGAIDVHQVQPIDLARKIDELARRPSEIGRLSREMDRWAETMSWRTLRGPLTRILERAADGWSPVNHP